MQTFDSCIEVCFKKEAATILTEPSELEQNMRILLFTIGMALPLSPIRAQDKPLENVSSIE